MKSQNEKGGQMAALITSVDLSVGLCVAAGDSPALAGNSLSAGGSARCLGIHLRYLLQQGVHASARLQGGVNRRMTLSVGA